MDSDDGYDDDEGWDNEGWGLFLILFLVSIFFLAACKVWMGLMAGNHRGRQRADACENNRDTNYVWSNWWNGHENNRDTNYVSLDTVSPDYSPDYSPDSP